MKKIISKFIGALVSLLVLLSFFMVGQMGVDTGLGHHESYYIRANFYLYNKTRHVIGSGSHIKLGKQSYILTCAHLQKEKDESLVAIDNYKGSIGPTYPLKLCKQDVVNDLALYKIQNLKDVPYLKVSKKESMYPQAGSTVYLLGNPGGFRDVISKATVLQQDEYSYLLHGFDHTGGSGGALLFRDRIIGVYNTLCCVRRPGVPWDIVHQCSNQKVLIEFLQEYRYSPNWKEIEDFLVFIFLVVMFGIIPCAYMVGLFVQTFKPRNRKNIGE